MVSSQSFGDVGFDVDQGIRTWEGLGRMPKSKGPKKKLTSKPKNWRKIEIHPDMKRLLPALGPVKMTQTNKDKILELIDSEFMSEGFHEFFWGGAIKLKEILNGYGIPLGGKLGREIVTKFVEHATNT